MMASASPHAHGGSPDQVPSLKAQVAQHWSVYISAND